MPAKVTRGDFEVCTSDVRKCYDFLCKILNMLLTILLLEGRQMDAASNGWTTAINLKYQNINTFIIY